MSRAVFQVRPGTIADCDEVLGMWLQARSELSGVARSMHAFSVDTLTAQLRTVLDNPELLVLLAISHDQIVGFAVARLTPPVPLGLDQGFQVESLYVDPQFRRRGAGQALLEGVAAAAERHGSRHITINTMATSREAQRFFARWGFSAIQVCRTTPTAALTRRLTAQPRGRRSEIARKIKVAQLIRDRISHPRACPPHQLEAGDVSDGTDSPGQVNESGENDAVQVNKSATAS